MEKTVQGDLDSLPEDDRARMAAAIDRLQSRDSLRMYNSLAERCFADCVDSFWRKTLGKQEEICVINCAQKFLKVSALVGIRLAELNDGTVQD